jgi:ABC-type glycerol-3-phosphate transport system permease component
MRFALAEGLRQVWGQALTRVNLTVAPARLMGRVTASIRLVTRTALPVGSLAGGALATAFNARTALVALLALQLAVPVRMWFSPVARVRRTAELVDSRV